MVKVEPLKDGLAGATEISADIKGKIVEFSFWQMKQGYSTATIEGRAR